MAIQVKNLKKTYRIKNGEETRALKGVSFNLPDAGLIFILGKSGCGKSTLLNMLGGLDGFDSGDIIVNGKAINGFKANEQDKYRNEFVGFVFQENNLLEEYTVKRNVGLALDLQSQKDTDKQIDDALESVGLKEFAEKKCHSISGGQKQRVAIARALVKKPQILLCDEPTGALDSETGAGIFNLLKQISQNTLVVVVSHDRESAENYGDRIIELKDGEILSDSAPLNDVLFKQENNKKTRGGVPLKRAVQLSFGLFGSRPLRLAICLILCFISFVSVGISSVLNGYDKAIAMVDTMEINKNSYFRLLKVAELAKNEGAFTKNEVKIISDNLNVRTDCVYSSSPQNLIYSLNGLLTDDPYGLLWNILNNFSISGYVAVDDIMLKDYGFTLYGNLPQKADEALLPLHLYKAFEKMGYRDSIKSTLSIAVNSYDDLIGKTIVIDEGKEFERRFKITGIVDTKVNMQKYGAILYTRFNNINEISKEDDELLNDAGHMLRGLHSALFVTSAYIDENSKDNSWQINSLVTPFGKSRRSDINVANGCRFRGIFKDTGGVVQVDCITEVSNEASRAIDDADDLMSLLSQIFFYVAILLIVLTVFYVVYYVFGIVTENKRKLGIMRALGASAFDIFKIFGIGVLLSTIILVAVSSAVTAVAAVVLNNLFINSMNITAKLISFGIEQFAVMAGVAIGATCVGVAVPVINLLHAKPVDVIAGRK